MRRIVELKRGKAVWLIDVPDAASDEAAVAHALSHANGYYDERTRTEVPPSNGRKGWEHTGRILDRLPHEPEDGQA